MIHNIEHEVRLINALGLQVVGPDKSERWLIFDDNKQVGFIQYKKLFNKNVKKGYPATFGYHMEIDNDVINYNATRKINNTNRATIDSTFNYGIDIKRDNDEVDHVELRLRDFPSLCMRSKQYGYIDFHIDYAGMYLNFKSKTDNFNVEELVIFKTDGENISNSPKEYFYQLRYCDKENELSDDNLEGVVMHDIIGKSTPYQQMAGTMKLVENKWIDGNLSKNQEFEVAGTIEEMVVKHQMGIEAFSHFRYFINEILPFKTEVIGTMLQDTNVERLGFFVPDLVPGKHENDSLKKVKE